MLHIGNAQSYLPYRWVNSLAFLVYLNVANPTHAMLNNSTTSRVQLYVINIFIVFVLLNNVQGMLSTWKIRMGKYAGVQLPYVSNLFYIYGVYGTLQQYNTSYVAVGELANKNLVPSIGGSGFIDLRIHDYFPQSHGEVRTRLGFLPILGNAKLMQQKYEWIAAAIKTAHNKNNPSKIVTRVFVYQWYWPPDAADYNLREKEGKLLFLGSK
jgi:hypothetical protein